MNIRRKKVIFIMSAVIFLCIGGSTFALTRTSSGVDEYFDQVVCTSVPKICDTTKFSNSEVIVNGVNVNDDHIANLIENSRAINLQNGGVRTDDEVVGMAIADSVYRMIVLDEAAKQGLDVSTEIAKAQYQGDIQLLQGQSPEQLKEFGVDISQLNIGEISDESVEVYRKFLLISEFEMKFVLVDKEGQIDQAPLQRSKWLSLVMSKYSIELQNFPFQVADLPKYLVLQYQGPS